MGPMRTMGAEKRLAARHSTTLSPEKRSIFEDAVAVSTSEGEPGPGHYDTSGSPYTNALAPNVAGPSVGAASGNAFNLFPITAVPGPGTYEPCRGPIPTTVFGKGSTRTSFVDDAVKTQKGKPGPGSYPIPSSLADRGHQFLGNDAPRDPWDSLPATPGPGAYHPRRAVSPAPVFGKGSARTSFVDDESKKHANKPAPHDYDVRGRPTSGGLWGATTGPRAMWGFQDTTPGPGEYKIEGMGSRGMSRERSPLAEKRQLRSVDGTHKKVGVADGNEMVVPNRSDEGFIYEVERRARLTPGPGRYEEKGVMDYAGSGDNPFGGATEVTAPLVNFADKAAKDNDWKVGPGAYKLPEGQVISAAFQTSERTSFVDDAVRISRGKPGPGAHKPCAKVNLGGQWGDTTVAFDLFPANENPGPGQYDLKGVMHAAANGDNPGGGATEPKGALVNFADKAALDNAWKVAPGLYDPPLPPLVTKLAPSVERRFGTCEVIPTDRGANSKVFNHAGTGDKSGGFRKVGPRDVVDEYRARLRFTKNAVLAYTMPSTLTTIAAKADESSYAKSGDGGHWRTMATGGAVFRPVVVPHISLSRGEKPPARVLSPRSQAIADADFPPKHKPRTPRTIRREYEMRCRLGRDFERVDAFVTASQASKEKRRGVKNLDPAAAVTAAVTMILPPSVTAPAKGSPYKINSSTSLANLAESQAFRNLLAKGKADLKKDHHRKRHGVNGDGHGTAESVASYGPAASIAAVRSNVPASYAAEIEDEENEGETKAKKKAWWAGV